MSLSTMVRAGQRLPMALQLLLFGVSVYAVGLLSVVWFRPAGSTLAVWWPAAGVGLVAVLVAPREHRRWVLATHLVATSAINVSGMPEFAVAGVLGLANALEILVIVTLLERGGRDPRRMHDTADLWRFLFAVAVGAVIVAFLVAVVVQVAYGVPLWSTVRFVAPSHLSALLLFGLLPMRQLSSRSEASRFEVLGQWLLVLGIVGGVFAPGQRVALVFLIVPALLWTSLRSGVRTLAFQLVTVAGLAAAMTLQGGGPFAATGAGPVRALSDSVALVQLFSTSLALVMLNTFLVVQARREAAARIASRDHRIRLVYERGLTGLVDLQVADGAMRIVHANRTAVGFLGGSNRGVTGSRWCDLFVDEDRQRLVPAVRSLIDGETDSWHGELRADTEHGQRWFEVALFVQLEPDGRLQLIAQMLDVTARRATEMRLSDLALRDPLTGAANRTLLLDRLEHALASARRSHKYVGLLFLDLDDFKPINDLYGHRAGDDLLVEVVRRLQHQVRPGDTVARVGGDEFAVVLAQLDDPAEVGAIVERLYSDLREPVFAGGDLVSVGVSIGAATSADTDDPHELIHQADARMYAEKQHGLTGGTPLSRSG